MLLSVRTVHDFLFVEGEEWLFGHLCSRCHHVAVKLAQHVEPCRSLSLHTVKT